MKSSHKLLLALVGATAGAQLVLAEPASKFSNQGGIVNTRHNLTQSPALGPFSIWMDSSRNNYAEVCVYCHTPHGANVNIAAPLWNRTIKATTYTTYNQLNTSTLTQAVYQPGAASLMCLSCHDGQQAVDAVMNMPGSGNYSTLPNEAFLDTWNNPSGFGGNHLTLGTPAWGPSGYPGVNFSTNTTCLTCHSPGVQENALSGSAIDFTAASIGTDLRDDHPVGVGFPATTGAGTDWNTPNGSHSGGAVELAFFDENSNSRPDKNEIRMYGSGGAPRVECASCHDPHGVPSAGPGSSFNPTFLRKTNQNSVVCLTCHSK